MKSFDLDDIEPGTVFECRIFTPAGLRLAEPFTPLSDERLQQLRMWDVATIMADSEPMTREELESYETEDVDDEPEDSEEAEPPAADTTPDLHPGRQPIHSKSDGLKSQIENSYRNCYEKTKDLIRPISKGLVDDSERIYQAIRPLTESIRHLPRLVLFLLADQKASRDREYINLFSLNTAIYSMLVAREMGVDTEEVRLIGAGGLVHDIGMLKIPQHIRKKEGSFNDEEREVMESHPQRGARILSGIDKLEESIATVAAEHHEQYDGKGYPRRIGSDNIHFHARVVHLTMAFTAMTQPRYYRARRGTIESIQSILEEEKQRFDPEVLDAFLRLIGIYPVGTFVELESGCHAMVVKPEPENQYQPQVHVFTDTEGDRIDEPYLVKLGDDDDGIKRVLPRDIMGYSALEIA